MDIEGLDTRKGDIANDLDEAVFVAFDRSGEGGELRIVTDPDEIKNIEREEQERKRNVSWDIINIPSQSVLININIS